MRCLTSAAAILLLSLSVRADGPVTFLDESFSFDRRHPASGHWLGRVDPGVGPGTWAAVAVERDERGGWTVRVTMLALMAIHSECRDVSIDEREVRFSLPVGARFEGLVSEDGQRLAGTFAAPNLGGEGRFELARTPRATDLPDPLAFTGVLEAPFGRLDMTLVFAETPGRHWVGQMDVPAQGLVACPFGAVTRDGPTITARLDVPGAPVLITGTLADDGDRLAGTFTQGPFSLELDFERAADYESPALERPQDPEPPFPYAVREVTIQHPSGHVLAGTVTVPEGAGPFPGAVLVSGSGPQDRDETVFGHRPFLVIADHLTRRGIAVLRYDDRGTGRSTGDHSTATSEDLATDAGAALAHLRSVDEVDAARVGIIGHSEGGLIGPMVAADDPAVAYLVLLAGPGVPGQELLKVQLELVLRAGGATEQAIAVARERQQASFDMIREGLSDEQIEAVIRPHLEQTVEGTGLGADDMAKAIQEQIQVMRSPWMRYFLEYDPRPRLRQVACPVLACNGTLDLQVWHEQNLPAIEQSVRDVTIRRYEGLNHLFQPATTGAVGEYGAIETTFDESVLRDIVEWIHEHAGS